MPLMPRILPDSIYDAMLSAADAAGATEVRARATFVRENLTDGTLPVRSIRPGTYPATLRCDPPPCVRLAIVADSAISSDWEAA